MINLGIVISVSKYTTDANSLPACERDGNTITAILRSEAKYDAIHVSANETTSIAVKTNLVAFLDQFKGKPIGEVVFYFTGHGDFVGDEFYYLLSDYEKIRRNQTSLENTELDQLIRKLQPALFVKIVDACHSGATYIKSAGEFERYLKSATGGFKKLYFMFSSQQEQRSYQDRHLSDFTKHIVEAIVKHPHSTIRYKEIIDYVSDAFLGNKTQTPFFVAQADFIEPFCSVTSSLLNAINSAINLKSPTEQIPTKLADDRTLSNNFESSGNSQGFDVARYKQLMNFAFSSDGLDLSKQGAIDWANSKLQTDFDIGRFKELMKFAYSTEGLDLSKQGAIDWALSKL